LRKPRTGSGPKDREQRYKQERAGHGPILSSVEKRAPLQRSRCQGECQEQRVGQTKGHAKRCHLLDPGEQAAARLECLRVQLWKASKAVEAQQGVDHEQDARNGGAAPPPALMLQMGKGEQEDSDCRQSQRSADKDVTQGQGKD
jgi:hypothetical protein